MSLALASTIHNKQPVYLVLWEEVLDRPEVVVNHVYGPSSRHHRLSVATVDLGTTLTDGSDYNPSKIRGVLVRPLTVIGPDTFGKADHLPFPQPFNFSKK